MKSCINRTLNKVPMYEFFVDLACINQKHVYPEHTSCFHAATIIEARIKYWYLCFSLTNELFSIKSSIEKKSCSQRGSSVKTGFTVIKNRTLRTPRKTPKSDKMLLITSCLILLWLKFLITKMNIWNKMIDNIHVKVNRNILLVCFTGLFVYIYVIVVYINWIKLEFMYYKINGENLKFRMEKVLFKGQDATCLEIHTIWLGCLFRFCSFSFLLPNRWQTDIVSQWLCR